MLTDNELKSVETIKKQFLCNVPLRKFRWENILNDNVAIQSRIIEETVCLDLVLKRPIKISYQKAFVKFIIDHLEGTGSSIDDQLYEEYARLVALPPSVTTAADSEWFKHYSISGKIISLKENPNLISQGTTGLRTWQAALALSEWIVQNREDFANVNVLELGSGVGLTGLVLTIVSDPKKVIFSDCHPAVLSTLTDNVKLNINNSINTCTSEFGDVTVEIVSDDGTCSRSVQILNLPWEEIDDKIGAKLGRIHKIVAADIVYDSELFPSLISAVECLFNKCRVDDFILCCTVRNHQTFDDFLQLTRNFQTQLVDVPDQLNFSWDTESPLKILKLTLKERGECVCYFLLEL